MNAWAVLGGLLLAGSADAAACCVTTSQFGGRLSPWETAAVTLGVSGAPTVGWWDEHGAWSPDAPGATDLELRASLAAILALGESFEVSGRVPWLLNRRTADGLTDVATAPGDASLAVRWAPMEGVGLNLGLVLPLGRSTATTRSPLGADVTGRGLWAVSGAVTVEQLELPWYLQLSIGATVPLPSGGQRFGPSLEVSVAGGRELTDGLVVHLRGRFTVESPRLVDGAAVANSDAHELAVGPSVSWKFHPHWTLDAAVETGLFANGMGDNRQGRVAGSTSLRYGFF